MSSNLPALQHTDLTVSDIAKADKFVEDGMPGLVSLNDVHFARMYELYLEGNTYNQIASILRIKKPLVLYLSRKHDWYAAKLEYLNDARESMKSRVEESKLKSREFMLLLVQAWQRKLTQPLSEFLATNDPKCIEGFALKEVSSLMKAIEMVNDMDNAGKDSKGKQPLIGLNTGDGVTIEKTGENTISITPKETAVTDMLKKYADTSRAEERKKFEVPQK